MNEPEECDEEDEVEVVAAVSFRDPTCADPTAGWTATVDGHPDASNDHVTFTQSGPPTPGQEIVVTARTDDDDYEFDNEDDKQTFEHTFAPAPAGCDEDATAVAPSVTQSTDCEVQGSYTVPETRGVQYLLDGKSLAAGTYPGPASGTVTATALAGHELTNPDFRFVLSLPAAADCPAPVVAGVQTVVPAYPTLNQPTCTANGSLNVPTQPPGVLVERSGSVPGEVTFTYKPSPGYTFPPGTATISTLTVFPKLGSDRPRCDKDEEPQVLGTQEAKPTTAPTAVPTAVDAGLPGAAAPRDVRLGVLLTGGGLLLLGWAGATMRTGRREPGAREI
jgi:hypothetical protein